MKKLSVPLVLALYAALCAGTGAQTIGHGAIGAVAGIYYVSTGGSDSNDGTTPALTWATIAHVNAQIFAAGTTVLFNGGNTFSGARTSPPQCSTHWSPPQGVLSVTTRLTNGMRL